MAFHSRKPALTAEERAARRKLILSDILSLAIILAVTALLALAASSIYNSYASHRRSLARRWDARGVKALYEKKPLVAIGALRSALALDPGNQQIEIELAESLAAAGRTEQAISYFNTLAEGRPGDGMINLQLARLSVRQGHEQQALNYYQRAIFGDWSGNGYLRRRQVRMEMIHYLNSRGLYLRARSELLISAGNAPQDDLEFLLRIAEAMEQARDPQNALHLYQQTLRQKPHSIKALEGAGRTAFALKQYRDADRYLASAADLLDNDKSEAAEATRNLLAQTRRILLLDPFPDLSPHDRALRILINRRIAEKRLADCAGKLKPTAAAARESANQPRPSLLRHPIQNLESRFKNSSTVEGAAKNPPSPQQLLANLQARWKQQPKRIALWRLERSQSLAQSQMQLVFDTERITAELCGAPSGDDALLLEMGRPAVKPDD